MADYGTRNSTKKACRMVFCTLQGLDNDAPEPRPVQGPEEGKIVALPQVGGLHHRYERLAA